MRNALATLGGCLAVTTTSMAQDGAPDNKPGSAQTLYPAGSQPSFARPEEYFTGEVQVQLLFPENDHTNTGSSRTPNNK